MTPSGLRYIVVHIYPYIVPFLIVIATGAEAAAAVGGGAGAAATSRVTVCLWGGAEAGYKKRHSESHWYQVTLGRKEEEARGSNGPGNENVECTAHTGQGERRCGACCRWIAGVDPGSCDVETRQEALEKRQRKGWADLS